MAHILKVFNIDRYLHIISQVILTACTMHMYVPKSTIV